MAVRIVTDSTAYLPPQLVAAHPSLVVVPLDAIVDGEPYVEGSPGALDTVAAALWEGRSVSTSRPAPQAFVDAYERCADEGAEAILSIHLSSALSATCDGARTAAASSPVPVEVIDSRVIGMAMGFAALAADDLAAGGASLTEIVQLTTLMLQGSSVYFYVDSLDYLRRGGRIGTAAALLGTALAVKPILTLADGKVVVKEKVRTTSRAVERLGALAALDVAAMGDEAQVAVHHLNSPERVATVRRSLRSAMPWIDPVIAPLGAVVAVHSGPGAIAVSVSPKVRD